MKISKVGKFGLILVLTILMGIQIVKSIAITQPMPFNLKMLRGDSVRFTFQIQPVTSKVKQSCTLSASDFDPLNIVFDEETVTVNPGENKHIYGTLTAPEDAPFKTYNGKITAKCQPSAVTEGTSGSVMSNTMVIGFELDVVETLEERMVEEIPEPERTGISTSAVLTIIIIVILVIGVGYWFSKKGKKEK